MSSTSETSLRRLGPGDEDVVRRLAEAQPQTSLLADERTIFIAAFDGDDPIGFAFGYDLPRRHGAPSILFVYELEVDEAYRRRGIARQLMTALRRESRSQEAFVLTEPENDAANALYASLGGTRVDSVMWDY
ncbi:MAG TPA: GNAT family N-acetyltransferase [Gaiellaceae bacterium]|nr:GNAT family N-acetyltransferase [Gaiellaceae bacterium]